MASSSLLRRGFRLASSSAPLLGRQHQLPSRLPPVAYSPCSSRRLLLLGGAPRTPAFPARAPFVAAARFASSAADGSGDAKLKKVLDAEIACAEEDVADRPQDGSESPLNFPFTIIDNSGDQTITLKRDFGNETIEVSVFLEAPEQVDEESDGGDNHTDDEESPMQMSLVVAVDKGSGPTLEFCCTINPQKINIDSVSLKYPDTSDQQSPYEGPEFTDLDEGLQKAFYEFLAQRGISRGMCSFLYEYMIQKEEREYLTWLKSMKEFVEK